MNHQDKPIATQSDVPAHPIKQTRKKIQTIKYRQDGEQIKVKLKFSLYTALFAAKERVARITEGKDFSQTIFVRRALTLYLTKLLTLTDDELLMEADHLSFSR
jgi:hypothetical protein